MLKEVARTGDRTFGTCSSHKSPIQVYGIIEQGSEHTFCDGLSMARVGDRVRASCGHISYIITGSSSSGGTGGQMVRVGDLVGDGPYEGQVIDGSGTTFAT